MEIIDYVYFGIYYIMLFSSTLWLLMFFSKRKKLLKSSKHSHKPSITFLIPAFNESKHIRKCIDSVLDLNYPKEKIDLIVINDGSSDGTKEICEEYENKGLIKFINQKNSGKAIALNRGLKFVNSDLVATLDADSYVTKNYLDGMLKNLDEDVVAVTPSTKITKNKTFSEKLQWIEYLFMIFLRKMFDFLGCQYVIPGVGSIIRTSFLKETGGFDENSIVEDTEIGFRCQHERLKIKNSMSSIVYTEAPESIEKLYRQRIRWYRGYFQHVFENKEIILNPKFGSFGVFLIPFNFVWLLILAVMLLDVSYRVSSIVVNWIFNYSLIGWDFLFLPLKLDPSLIMFNINIYTVFTFMFALIGVLTVYVSLKCSFEKVGLKSKKINYILFLFVYPIFISIMWLSSLLHEALKRKRIW